MERLKTKNAWLGPQARHNLERDKKVLGKGWHQTYKGYFGEQKNSDAFIRIVKPFLPQKGKVDVVYPCSGNGVLGEALVRALAQHGVKSELTLIDISGEHLGQNLNPLTKKIHGDILKVKLKAVFDCALMRSSLDYFPTKEMQIRVLQQIRRWLRPGGVFFNQAASLPSKEGRDLADKIYRSSTRIGHRHFQCSQDIFRLYKKAGFARMKKIGEAPFLAVTEKEHRDRYALTRENISGIQNIIKKIPSSKREHIQITRTGYAMKFSFPVYAAWR